MPDFISKLAARINERWESLTQTLTTDAAEQEATLRDLMSRHWHPLPADLVPGARRGPAFAVDGSVRRVNLANGAFLFTAQALLMGEGRTETDVDIEILRGTIPRGSIERFADLFLQRLEVGLARDYAHHVPEGSVIFLDGALYGQLPQLYPLTIEGIEAPLVRERVEKYPQEIIEAYLELFQECQRGYRFLISIAKTSREATHAKIWAREEGMEGLPLEVPDSEMIYRWTGDQKGYSTPVILGTWGFTRGSRELIERGDLKDAPAIVSFFVRLADYDDAVRVDVPAFCLGDERLLGAVEGEIIAPDTPAIHGILEILAGDYGGPEVYNALLYAVDREVRLERRTMNNVYLSLIQRELGCELRLDRSDRRF
ncbi:MAG: DNA double-strand break repair nuclease NurA [Chloroflexi bacterium]|nr:MAG: DNA double-strand break repair nuclease NurA [Chloroflexota bacterium]